MDRHPVKNKQSVIIKLSSQKDFSKGRARFDNIREIAEFLSPGIVN